MNWDMYARILQAMAQSQNPIQDYGVTVSGNSYPPLSSNAVRYRDFVNGTPIDPYVGKFAQSVSSGYNQYYPGYEIVPEMMWTQYGSPGLNRMGLDLRALAQRLVTPELRTNRGGNRW